MSQVRGGFNVVLAWPVLDFLALRRAEFGSQHWN